MVGSDARDGEQIPIVQFLDDPAVVLQASIDRFLAAGRFTGASGEVQIAGTGASFV